MVSIHNYDLQGIFATSVSTISMVLLSTMSTGQPAMSNRAPLFHYIVLRN